MLDNILIYCWAIKYNNVEVNGQAQYDVGQLNIITLKYRQPQIVGHLNIIT